MKNLTLEENGGSIAHYTSQYHHESRCSNLLIRDYSVWFSSVKEQLPQAVTFKLQAPTAVSRIGIFLHGENNQNPQCLEISLSNANPAAGATHPPADSFTIVVNTTLEHRAGDHLFTLDPPVTASFVKFNITENFGGSGIYVSKCYVFGEPA